MAKVGVATDNPLHGDGATWVEKYDESSQRAYYANTVTGEKSWRKPDGFDGGSGESGAFAMPPAMAPAGGGGGDYGGGGGSGGGGGDSDVSCPWERRVQSVEAGKVFAQHLAARTPEFEAVPASGWTSMRFYDRTEFRTVEVVAEHVVGHECYYGGGVYNGGLAYFMRFWPRLMYWLGWDVWETSNSAEVSRSFSKTFYFFLALAEIYYFCGWIQAKKFSMVLWVFLYLLVRRHFIHVLNQRKGWIGTDDASGDAKQKPLLCMIQKILLLLVFVGLAGRGLGIMFGDLNRTALQTCAKGGGGKYGAYNFEMLGFEVHSGSKLPATGAPTMAPGPATKAPTRLPTVKGATKAPTLSNDEKIRLKAVRSISVVWPFMSFMPMIGNSTTNREQICGMHHTIACKDVTIDFNYTECSSIDYIFLYGTCFVWVLLVIRNKMYLLSITMFDAVANDTAAVDLDTCVTMTLEIEVLQMTQLLMGRAGTKKIKVRTSMETIDRFRETMTTVRPTQLKVIETFGKTLAQGTNTIIQKDSPIFQALIDNAFTMFTLLKWAVFAALAAALFLSLQVSLDGWLTTGMKSFLKDASDYVPWL